MGSVRWFNSNVRALILSKNPVQGSKQEWADKERQALSCGGEFGLDWDKRVLKYYPFFWISWASFLTWLGWSRGDELVLNQNCPGLAVLYSCRDIPWPDEEQPEPCPCSGLWDPSVLKLLPLAVAVWRNWKCNAFRNCSHHLVLEPTFG